MLTWIDLETTGLDERTDEILEIGVVATDDELNEIAAESWVVRPSNRAVLLSMSEFVRSMHVASGLLDEVQHDLPRSLAATAVHVEAFIHTYTSKPTPMCGSSVGFDRRFLAYHVPELERAFTYRTIDVSSIKELVRRWRPEVEYAPEGGKPHRALPDIRHSIAELAHYRKAGFIG